MFSAHTGFDGKGLTQWAPAIKTWSNSTPRCWDFGLKVADSLLETGPICLHNSAGLLSVCFGENHSCGRVGKELIIAFPQRRHSYTMQMTNNYTTTIYCHYARIYFHLCSLNVLRSSCQSLSKCSIGETVFIFPSWFLTHILSLQNYHMVMCCHLVATWQHCFPVWIAQQFGMWMYKFQPSISCRLQRECRGCRLPVHVQIVNHKLPMTL